MPRRLLGFSILLAATLSCARDDTASAHPRKGSPDDGVPPRPSVIAPVTQVIRPSIDQNVCGNSIVAKNVTLSGTRVPGAIVWLTDIRTGKAFPIERRYDLTNDGCTLDPYVQVMATSGTLNLPDAERK